MSGSTPTKVETRTTWVKVEITYPVYDEYYARDGDEVDPYDIISEFPHRLDKGIPMHLQGDGFEAEIVDDELGIFAKE